MTGYQARWLLCADALDTSPDRITALTYILWMEAMVHEYRAATRLGPTPIRDQDAFTTWITARIRADRAAA